MKYLGSLLMVSGILLAILSASDTWPSKAGEYLAYLIALLLVLSGGMLAFRR